MERDLSLLDMVLIPLVILMVINIVFASFISMAIRWILLGMQSGLLVAMLIYILYFHFIIKSEMKKVEEGIEEENHEDITR